MISCPCPLKLYNKSHYNNNPPISLGCEGKICFRCHDRKAVGHTSINGSVVTTQEHNGYYWATDRKAQAQVPVPLVGWTPKKASPPPLQLKRGGRWFDKRIR